VEAAGKIDGRRCVHPACSVFLSRPATNRR